MEYRNNRHDPVHTGLSKKQFEEVSDCLSTLAEKLGVTAVLLINSAGQTVAQKVRSGQGFDATILSTLTAGSYAAAKEMARILGEKDNFKMVLHEGERRNVYVSSVNADFSLILVFEKGVALGIVRLFAKRTIEQLLSVLPQPREASAEIDQIFDRRFQSLLGEELDRAFNELFQAPKKQES